MTLLEQWKEKTTWNNQLPLVPLYTYKNDMDLDLAALIQKADSLTFNKGSKTGFKEIGWTSAIIDYPFGQIEYEYFGINNIAQTLISILKANIKKTWNPNISHLILTSGGVDSRIISLIMKQLRDDGMDLGDFHFRCHGYESELFLKSMIEQGWNKKNYSVMCDPEGYKWGEFNKNINAFVAPQLDFIWDIEGFHKEPFCLVSGSYGGELVMYSSIGKDQKYTPTDHGQQRIDLELLRLYAKHPAFYLSKFYYQFDDYIMPYLSYDYLDYVFGIPKLYFVREKGLNDLHHWTMDIIRAAMLRELGNKTPIVNERHSYEYRFSWDDRVKIHSNWVNSKLYNDFPEVRLYEPALEVPNNVLSTRLYGLATCYEVAKKDV